MQSQTYVPDFEFEPVCEERAEPPTLELRPETDVRPHVAATRWETIFALVYGFLALAGVGLLAAVAVMAAY